MPGHVTLTAYFYFTKFRGELRQTGITFFLREIRGKKHGLQPVLTTKFVFFMDGLWMVHGQLVDIAWTVMYRFGGQGGEWRERRWAGAFACSANT